MIACSGNNISKMYGGNFVFEGISFEIPEGEKIGVVGRNGSGKTTFFKILAGLETPDTGQIHWKKGCKIGYLQQIPQYPDEQTAMDILQSASAELLSVENEMKKIEAEMGEEQDSAELNRLVEKYGALQEHFARENGYGIGADIERISSGLGIQHLLEQPFNSLSGGEKTKVCLGMMLLKNPDMLLLDEPTNHLDLKAVEWLTGFIQAYEGTVVIISHDRYFLDEAVCRILDLEDGELTQYNGNYTAFVSEKEERLLREFQQYEEQQKKIKKMKESIKRLREWANQSNPPNAGLHRRAKSMEKALERITKLDRPQLNRRKIQLELDSGERSGNNVLLLKDISQSFNGSLLFTSVNMHIRYLDRSVIVGDNGTGKSTLLKIMMEQLVPDAGEVAIGSNVKAGYLSQHVFQEGNASVIESFREEVHVSEEQARHILAKFLFYGYSVFKKVSSLSGGEKMRLRLAQLMYQDMNLLILDEPTNHLDIESREVLEDALLEFSGTIVAVSHDRYFMNKIFNRVYWLEHHTLIEMDGDYDRAREKMKQTIQRMKEEKPIKLKSHAAPVKPEEKLVTADLELEIEQLETQIHQLEKQLEKIISLEELQQLFTEKERLEVEREKLYKALEEYC